MTQQCKYDVMLRYYDVMYCYCDVMRCYYDVMYCYCDVMYCNYDVTAGYYDVMEGNYDIKLGYYDVLPRCISENKPMLYFVCKLDVTLESVHTVNRLQRKAHPAVLTVLLLSPASWTSRQHL